MGLLKQAKDFEQAIAKLGDTNLLAKAKQAQKDAAKAAEKARQLYDEYVDSQTQEKDR